MIKTKLNSQNNDQMSPEDTIATMATVLRTKGTDLGDEREVIRVLTGARFLSGDVMLYMDRAIERARASLQQTEG